MGGARSNLAPPRMPKANQRRGTCPNRQMLKRKAPSTDVLLPSGQFRQIDEQNPPASGCVEPSRHKNSWLSLSQGLSLFASGPCGMGMAYSVSCRRCG